MAYLDILLGGYKRVQNAGTNLPAETNLNFLNATIADNPSNKSTDITINSVVSPGTAAQLYQTNSVPAGSWATISGDAQVAVGGAWTNVKINGASVPTAGGLTTGNVLQVTGGSALGYGAVNLAGGAGYVTGLLPAADIAPGTNTYILTTTGGVAGWAAPAASGITALTGQVTASGSGSVAATITPGTAGQIAITNGSTAFAWTSLAKIDTTTGALTAGGSGSYAMASMGPLVGSETTRSGLYLLSNGGTPSSGNFAIESDGSTFTYYNTGGAMGALTGGSTFLWYVNASIMYWGGTTGAAPLLLDWSTSTTPILRAGTSATSFTVGTNKSGAVLNLQADAATTYAQLAAGGIQLLSGTPSLGSGTLVIGINNCSVAPTTNPSGGGILYVQAGALKYRGSSGTVTTLGPA